VEIDHAERRYLQANRRQQAGGSLDAHGPARWASSEAVKECRSMDFEGRTLRRTTFDAVADDYDRVRPSYPEQVFGDLVDLAGLSPGARLLEIGCGTGRATIPLAQRGFNVVAVELGEHLAALARRRLADFPTVDVVRATFEEWEPAEAADFDAVVSFAAFHWIDPDVRYAKAARLLKADGALAVFELQDTLTADGDPFFLAVQEDFAAVVPEWEVTPPLSPDRIVDREKAYLDASGCFAPAEARRYVWSVTFTAHDYVTFLGTTTNFRMLDEARRSRLFDRMERRITAEHGGAVRKEFLGTLAVARRSLD
jgi:SAM-dependent methyltransferase